MWILLTNYSRVTQQLAWQFETYSSLETKAIGVLAFDGALCTFVAVLHPMPLTIRLVFFLLLGISILGCLMSLNIRRLYAGPHPALFYDDARALRDVDLCCPCWRHWITTTG